MEIFKIGGSPDWVCANSIEEANKIYETHLKSLGYTNFLEEIKEYPPSKLSEEDLDSHMYTDNNSAFLDEDKDIRTFREELKRRTKPEMFAFTDF